MNKYLLIIIAIVVIVGGFLFLNKNSQTLTQNNKLQVTASFYPVYYFSSEIGGDKADVKNITPAGAEPHDYEPTAKDVARLETGKLLIVNGGVETWEDKIKENLKDKNVKIVKAGEGLLNKELTEDGKKVQDPHVWLDPVLAKQELEKIRHGFADVDPVNVSSYDANAKSLGERLDKLDQEYKTGLENCQQRDFVTSHEAFGYLAARYGLNQVAISGLSPDEEPSPARLAEVTKFVRESNVKYIFFETLVSPKLSETIAKEVGAQTLVLDPIEGISDDDIKQGKNYFTVMEDNLKNLQTALECSK